MPLVQLPDKKTWETVPYQLDFGKNSQFKSNKEAIASKFYAIFKIDDTDEVSDYSGTMVYATSNTTTIVQCDTTGGEVGATYVWRARVICDSGRRYEECGYFTILPNW